MSSYTVPNLNLNKVNPLDFVHSPAEAGNTLIAYAETTKNNPGPTWGIPAVDKVVIPERPGEVITIQGRPGDGKTSILAYRARREAMQIADDPSRHGEIVVYVAWEGTVETLEPFWLADPELSKTDIAWGRADLEKLKHKVITTRAKLPIWMIGYSGEQRKRMGRDVRKVPPLTAEMVFEIIEGMTETWPNEITKIRLMLFDYVQRAPAQGHFRSRFEAVGDNALNIEDLAIRIGCPALMGAQAGRQVDSRGSKTLADGGSHADHLAGMEDAQDSSKIEQVSSKIFSLWRPWRTEAKKYPMGTIARRSDGVRVLPSADFQINGEKVELTETLLLMRMVKQRDDSPSHTWKLNFHPAYLKLVEF